MDTSQTEIIDLTDDHEVIVLDSEHEDATAGPSKPQPTFRLSSRGDKDPDAQLDADERSSRSATRTRPSTPEAGSSSQAQDSKRKKPRRKKKRKSAVVVEERDGDEEGEIVEVPVEEDSRGVVINGKERAGDDEEDSIPEVKSNKGKGKERGRSLSRPSSPDYSQRSRSASLGSRPDALPDLKSSTEARKYTRKTQAARQEKDADDPPLFFIDEEPAEIPINAKPVTQPSVDKPVETKPQTEEEHSALLLPAHVIVFEDAGDVPLEIIPPPPVDSDDDDYIDYLDYDDDRRAPGTVRYFDDPAEVADAKVAKASRIVCKNCGAEGEHKTYECPVIICLTCGARDEHITRSCPISKTCFSCGMKGHVSRTCPNRYSGRSLAGHYDDCDRCGSSFHMANECPTLWRMYEYVEDAERQMILSVREQKRDLAIGQGGEGYIAPEDWCYNCGGCGHLGDVGAMISTLTDGV
ncbi:hypothetical protein NM688_g8695 [Phlebia brevispora]|uniref:Uncharacterized protein n=1 Tax=Phlebia brevispora TaxID=194682 RepID=A0ACC1RNV1_9APHY|nr:hypothetical protein NM688_g8695 [Phlebia brevispora]